MASSIRWSLSVSAALVWTFVSLSAPHAYAQKGSVPAPPVLVDPPLSPTAARQIQALLDEKAKRSPAQEKISANLLHALKTQKHEATSLVASSLRSNISVSRAVDAKGQILVDIRGTLDKTLVEAVNDAGGTVLHAVPGGRYVRARVPVENLETLAAAEPVKFVRAAMPAKTHSQMMQKIQPDMTWAQLSGSPTPAPRQRVSFEARAKRIREQLAPMFGQAGGPQTSVGAGTSAGDAAHGADLARSFFGVNGAGVKIGVLSDSVDHLAASIASGDLPPVVEVLPGQSGVPGSGEGTAMLEIIHDLAPGAQLAFATAFISDQSFADNIRALREAGCDIIVDDIIYANESPFQDGVIAQAVNEVTADGAFYFSSAGNDGNFNDGTSSVWEGDFRAGGTLASLPGGIVHNFGAGVISNRVESAPSFVLAMFWSDPLGASGNDYDFFIFNNTLTTILDAGVDTQDGDDDPFEITFPAFANERVVILRVNGAENRALHLNNFGGQFALATSGSTHGHSTAARAFGVAAVAASLASGGAFSGGPTNPVELFSSDGNRRVFRDFLGAEYTPGNVLFAGGGGQNRRKPDLAAADGVVTTVPGFIPFFGTSAAAPHAAAIAGLVKSAKPNTTANRMRQVLTNTALDIEAAGVDRDSGAGIVSAFDALAAVGATPQPLLETGTVATTVIGGDGDEFLEPGEVATLLVPLVNVGGATAITVRGTLTSLTPGVTVTVANSNYPNIGSSGGTGTNATPYRISVGFGVPCGTQVELNLRVTYAFGSHSPQNFTIPLAIGEPGTPTAISYTGPAVNIPDNNPTGVNIPITVSGFSGALQDVNFRFDGATCTAAVGATTVGVNHTWIGDLVVTLRSPSGTTVTLMNQAGGALVNSGNNLCQTVLDDAAANSIQAITPAQNPFTGTFRPAAALSAFNGENANGVWTLNVSDRAAVDIGAVRAFSLVLAAAACDNPISLTTTAPVVQQP